MGTESTGLLEQPVPGQLVPVPTAWKSFPPLSLASHCSRLSRPAGGLKQLTQPQEKPRNLTEFPRSNVACCGRVCTYEMYIQI